MRIQWVGNSQADSGPWRPCTSIPRRGILEMQVEGFVIGTRISGGRNQSETELTIAATRRKPLLETGDVSFADIGGLDSVMKASGGGCGSTPVRGIHRGGKPPIGGLTGEPGTGRACWRGTS